MKTRRFSCLIFILTIVLSFTSCGGPDFEKVYEDVKEEVSQMKQKDKLSYHPQNSFKGDCKLSDDKNKIIIENSYNEKGYGGRTDMLIAIAVSESFEAAKDFSKMFIDKLEMSEGIYEEIKEALSSKTQKSGSANDNGVKVSWETTGFALDTDKIKTEGRIDINASYRIVFEKD